MLCLHISVDRVACHEHSTGAEPPGRSLLQGNRGDVLYSGQMRVRPPETTAVQPPAVQDPLPEGFGGMFRGFWTPLPSSPCCAGPAG